jgi:menaquinol-cytochrome c reductase iron-sulfur subunit
MSCCPDCVPPSGDDRRGFFAKFMAVCLGGTAVGLPSLSGLLAFLSPMRERSKTGQLVRLAPLEGLPEDGTPVQFPVIAERSDAWNNFGNQPIGSVFLRRLGPDKVSAIHVVCPHAGCFITYDAGGKKFYCPCHQGSFDLTGKRTDKSSPSPRDLDTLEVEIKDKTVFVKFENYRTGTTEKVVQA